MASSQSEPRYKRHVKDLFPAQTPEELSHLLEAAESGQSLLRHPGFVLIQAIVREEVEAAQSVFAYRAGPPVSQAEYAAGHGFLSGLTAPEKALHALIAHAESCESKAQELDAQSSAR